MQPRQLAIVAVATLVAFAAAFGAGKLGRGSSKDAAASAGKPAEVIHPEGATVAANVSAAVPLPALQMPHKRKKKPAASTSAPPAQAQPQAQPRQQTQTQTRTQTQTQSSSPAAAAPQQKDSAPSNNDPIKVGGGDG